MEEPSLFDPQPTPTERFGDLFARSNVLKDADTRADATHPPVFEDDDYSGAIFAASADERPNYLIVADRKKPILGLTDACVYLKAEGHPEKLLHGRVHSDQNRGLVLPD